MAATLIQWETLEEKLAHGVSFQMIKLPSGIFMMGDNHGEYDDEKPEHEVELDSFWLGQYPVTQQIWEAVMGENPSYFKGENRPVEQISWDDTQVFLKRLNDQLKLHGAHEYRLPTEAEWEYASRTGNRLKYAGSMDLEMVGWFVENSSGQSHEVGLKAPNEWGLYDMSGNVWEWCQDGYSETYYQECFDKGKVKNPKGPESGVFCMLRGGSWHYLPQGCRVSVRGSYEPDVRYGEIGFRLARTI